MPRHELDAVQRPRAGAPLRTCGAAQPLAVDGGVDARAARRARRDAPCDAQRAPPGSPAANLADARQIGRASDASAVSALAPRCRRAIEPRAGARRRPRAARRRCPRRASAPARRARNAGGRARSTAPSRRRRRLRERRWRRAPRRARSCRRRARCGCRRRSGAAARRSPAPALCNAQRERLRALGDADAGEPSSVAPAERDVHRPPRAPSVTVASSEPRRRRAAARGATTAVGAARGRRARGPRSSRPSVATSCTRPSSSSAPGEAHAELAEPRQRFDRRAQLAAAVTAEVAVAAPLTCTPPASPPSRASVTAPCLARAAAGAARSRAAPAAAAPSRRRDRGRRRRRAPTSARRGTAATCTPSTVTLPRGADSDGVRVQIGRAARRPRRAAASGRRGCSFGLSRAELGAVARRR